MPARTVSHGIDESCASFAKLPSRGNEASRCHQEDMDMDWQYINGIWTPKGVVSARYSFDVNGGAVSTIDLGVTIPAGFVITDAWIHVVDALLSLGSATLALQVEAAGDILGTTAKASLGTGVWVAGVPDGTVTHLVQATVNRNLKAVIATAAATAGIIDVHMQGFQGQLT